jgi:hypothetical protein
MSARVAFASYNGVKVKTPYAITVGHPHSSLLDPTLKMIADYNSTKLCGTHLGYAMSEYTYIRIVKERRCELKDGQGGIALGFNYSYSYVNYDYRLCWKRDGTMTGFCGGDNKVVWGTLIINTCNPEYESLYKAVGPALDKMLLIHELGHSVGLGHQSSCEASSVMLPKCPFYPESFIASLMPMDKTDINALYP